MLRGSEGQVNCVLHMMEYSAQPGQDMESGFRLQNEGDIESRQRARNESGPSEKGNPGPQAFGFLFVHTSGQCTVDSEQNGCLIDGE